MKTLKLNNFTYTENSFEFDENTIIDNKYTYEKDGYKFVIHTTANGKNWMGATYKNNKTLGELSLAFTPEDVLKELNFYLENNYLQRKAARMGV